MCLSIIYQSKAPWKICNFFAQKYPGACLCSEVVFCNLAGSQLKAVEFFVIHQHHIASAAVPAYDL